ncbi:MAG: EMC3/TMCO1 family protein [Aigarchaeota archaeon]|nr:EMC3/TMCO1 family protein [Candidatus Calditenuis fumarioli]
MPIAPQAIEIMALTAALSLATALLRRMVFTREDMLLMAEVQEYHREVLKAVREKDPKALQRLEKRKEYYQRVQARLMGKNVMLMFATLAIYLGFLSWATAHYGTGPILRAPPGFYLPFVVHGDGIPFFGWYILSAFAFGTLLNRVINPPVQTSRRQPARGERVAEQKAEG